MVSANNFMSLRASPVPVEPISVAFGEWLPDLPEEGNPGAVEALNVIPSDGSYVPFKDLSLLAGALPTACLGAVEVFQETGSPVLYAGTTGGLFTRVSSAFVNVFTPPTTLYDRFYWQFIQFGGSIVALHPQLRPLVADVGGGSVFSPLAGAPPIAKCGARVGDFLVLGNLENEPDLDGPVKPSRIRWSGFNNIEADWTTDPTTQADFNDMATEGGAVTAITGREYGTIFQERSISRLTYVGLPTVFDIETVEEERGAISTGSVADIGAFVFFIAQDGFYIWNGTNTTPIGDNKVNTYFFKRLNYAARNLIVSAIDFANNCVVWAFPTGSGVVLDELIIYSYKENRFSHSSKVVEWLMSGYTFDASLEDLTGNLDVDYGVSFDDGIYQGRRPFLAGFGQTHRFGFFTGAALAATIDTAEFTGPGGTRVFSNSARPIVDSAAADATIQTAARDQLRGGALAFSAPVAQEITGEVPILVDARYVRFRANIPAGATWNHAQGVEVWRKTTGRV